MKQSAGLWGTSRVRKGEWNKGHEKWFLSQHFKRFVIVFTSYLSPSIKPGTVYFLYVKCAFQCIDYETFKQRTNNFWGLRYVERKRDRHENYTIYNCFLSKSHGNMCNILKKKSAYVIGRDKNSSNFIGLFWRLNECIHASTWNRT